MAIMRPDVDPEEIAHDSERLVYIGLRDQLSNEYVVLHSYPWLRPDRDGKLREGEADFVVLHQERGMLVLEVKGGELRFEGGQWERLKSAGFAPITDPFKQSRKSMHFLVERIEARTIGEVQRHDFTYGHAVVFPHVNYQGQVPPGAEPELIISNRQMKDLCTAIELAFAQWPQRDKSLSPHQWRRLLSALLPEFKLFRPFSVNADDLLDRIQELTEEQLELLQGLYEENTRVYVSGVAGSGKTQLAIDRAIHLAREGKRVLFVCYNKHLAEHLNRSIRNGADSDLLKAGLKIVHFHSLARELIEDAMIKWQPPEETKAMSKFFVDEVPDLMEQAAYLLMEQGEKVQYDAIVMDESQDFHTRWWEVLQCTLLKNAESGVLFAFADPFQRLWDWAPSEPPIAFHTKYPLRRNCRNSRWIARTSTTIANTHAQFFKRSLLGEKPSITKVANQASMKGIVAKTIEHLTQHHDVTSSQIVLIGPRNRENGSLSEISHLGGAPLTDCVDEWQANQGILVTTARSFKGLEADVVVVYDLNELSEGFSLVDLYVACTRARSHVHFLVTGKQMQSDLRDAIAAAEQQLAE
jgi:hypothetical protein